ncbi:hypothetical protein FKP32DRAFT_1591833 [Trametes sanguinea]|nr:hypothetical protein FKP32DRAFT_1591833 [Trametes sanguinea]
MVMLELCIFAPSLSGCLSFLAVFGLRSAKPSRFLALRSPLFDLLSLALQASWGHMAPPLVLVGQCYCVDLAHWQLFPNPTVREEFFFVVSFCQVCCERSQSHVSCDGSVIYLSRTSLPWGQWRRLCGSEGNGGSVRRY